MSRENVMVYNSLRMAVLLAIGGTLTACSSGGFNGSASNYQESGYQAQDRHEYYQARRGYYSSDARGGGRSRGVSVPQSYHFSDDASPKKHSVRDGDWIAEQNPDNFTIQLDSGEKAAGVAQTIHSTPKKCQGSTI